MTPIARAYPAEPASQGLRCDVMLLKNRMGRSNIAAIFVAFPDHLNGHNITFSREIVKSFVLFDEWDDTDDSSEKGRDKAC